MRKLLMTMLMAAAAAMAGCVADRDALEEHMVDECHVAPIGPACALADDEGKDAMFSRFIAKDVPDTETGDCILAVDCSDDRMRSDADGALDDLLACIAAGHDRRLIRELGDRIPFATVDETCALSCDDDLSACGTDGSNDGCGADVVGGCFAVHDDCIRDCVQQ